MLRFLEPENPNAVITYDAIIAAAGNGVTLADSVRSDNDSFYLKPGDSDIDDIVKENKHKEIQDFILQFLLGNTEANTYMTFDAAPKVVGKIFRNHNNVSGLIIPQNIGDSATTSFTKLGANDNLYVFPKLQVPGKKYEADTFICDRKIFLGEGPPDNISSLTLYYQNEGFNSKFPFNFRFGILDPSNNKISKSYTSGAKQGPSLDYLLELVLETQKGDTAYNATIIAGLSEKEAEDARVKAINFSRVVPATACLQIGNEINPVGQDDSIKRQIIKEKGAIFFDIKRGGDQHVALAVLVMLVTEFIKRKDYIILVTLDRMLALLARLLGIPCILHHNDTMTLYKNKYNDLALPPEKLVELLKERNAKFVTQYKSLYEKYTDIDVGGKKTVLPYIESLLTSIHAYIAVDASGTPYNQYGLTLLEHNRITDIYNHLNKFYDFLCNYEKPAHIDDVITIITSAAATAAATAAAATSGIDDFPKYAANKIKEFISLVETNNFTMTFLIDLAAMISSGDLVFNHMKEYAVFNYSHKQFQALEKAKVAYDAAAAITRPPRIPKFYHELLNNSDGYNTLLSEIAQTFYNNDVRESNLAQHLYKGADEASIKSAIDRLATYKKAEEACNANKDKPIQERKPFQQEVDRLLPDAITASIYLRDNLKQEVPDPPNIYLQTKFVTCQKGGVYSREKIKVLIEIYDKAGRFMNNEIGRIFPEITIKYALDQLLYYKTLKKIKKNSINDNLSSEAYNNLIASCKSYISMMKEKNTAGGGATAAAGGGATAAAGGGATAAAGGGPGDELAAAVADIVSTGDITSLNRTKLDSWIATYYKSISVDTIVQTISTSSAVTLLTELYSDWLTVLNEEMAEEDDTDRMISILLNPYADDTELTLNPFHPLKIKAAERDTYLKNVTKDICDGYYNIDRPVVYSLLVLTLLDDIIKGNTSTNMSLVTASYARLPKYIIDLISKPRWSKLSLFIETALIAINNSSFSKQSLILFTGGARKAHKNRTRKLRIKHRRTAKRR